MTDEIANQNGPESKYLRELRNMLTFDHGEDRPLSPAQVIPTMARFICSEMDKFDQRLAELEKRK